MNQQTELVVINSTGPMGSTVLGAIVEKFSYLNVPLRKLGLHEYLCHERKLGDPYLKSRIRECLQAHGRPVYSGGINVSDRDQSKPRRLVNANTYQQQLKDFMADVPNTVAELYDQGRSLYASAICYKENLAAPGKHIEYTTDISRYPADELWQRYQDEFPSVKMIHLHRDFSCWLDSLISQRFMHPSYKVRLFFPFTAAAKQYRNYEAAVNQYPGLHLDINDLFLPKLCSTLDKLSAFLQQPLPTLTWEEETYDLYGKLTSYEKAFTKADHRGKYVSNFAHRIFNFFYQRNKQPLLTNVCCYAVYLVEYCRYRMCQKFTSKGNQE